MDTNKNKRLRGGRLVGSGPRFVHESVHGVHPGLGESCPPLSIPQRGEIREIHGSRAAEVLRRKDTRQKDQSDPSVLPYANSPLWNRRRDLAGPKILSSMVRFFLDVDN